MKQESQDILTCGQRIRSERVRLGWTQSELASIGGVSKTTQVGYEADVHPPGLTYLAAIHAAGVDALFVLHGERTSSYVANHMDWGLVEELMTIIDEWESTRRRQTPVSLKTQILKLLYMQFCADGIIDHKVVVQTLQLAA